MKRLLLILAMFPIPAMAQFTAVTATVPDLANATYIADFIGLNTTPGAGPYLLGGVSVFPTQLTGAFTGSGMLNVSLADNNQILPLTSQWRFNVCVQSPTPPSPICFNIQVTITGTSQNISSQLNAALPPIPPVGNAVLTSPPSSQTIVQPPNSNLAVTTSGTGLFTYNGNTVATTNQITPTGTAVLFGPTTTQTVTQPINTSLNIITSGTGALNYNGSPVLTSLVGALLASPSTSQTVAQPSGTTLSSSSTDGVINPTVAPYSTTGDIGAWINAAATALGAGGRIFIPSNGSCYSFSTPIVIINTVKLTGSNVSTTCLHYTASTGTAITMSGANSAIENLLLQGPATGGQTNTGVLIAAPGFRSLFMNIGGGSGFATGLTFGNNAYIETFINSEIDYNSTNILWPISLSNSGENISFIGGNISNGQQTHGGNCVQIGTAGSLASAEISFIGVSFDGCQVVNNEGILKIANSHFEDVGILEGIPFIYTHSGGIEGNADNQGTYLDGITFSYGVSPTGVGLMQVDGVGNMHLSNLTPHGNPGIPVVYLSGSAPRLKFEDSANALTAGLLGIASGTNPIINVSTAGQFVANSAQNAAFSMGANPILGQNNIVLIHDNGVNFYTWTGTGNAYYAVRIQNGAAPGVIQSCSTSNITFTGNYSALGSETWSCAGNINSTSTAPTGSCTPNGYIIANVNGSTIHLATCP